MTLSRRGFLNAGIAGMFGTRSGASRSAASRTARKPNILLLMADQFRADCLGAEGNSVVHTPNLDHIASEGTRFRCAYSAVPSCTPARAALLTGLGPWRNGMLGYGRVAETYENEMPRMLRGTGYYGVGIGKMHWHPQRNLHGFHQTLLDESGRVESPDFVSNYRAWFREQAPDLNPDATGIGWNDYESKAYALPERLHPTRWTADRAVEFLDGYRRKEPFFLKVSFARPHSPYDPPERFMKLYASAPLPKAFIGDWAERNARRGEAFPSDTWRGDLGADQVRRSRQGYYGSVTFVDEQIGRILAALEKQRLTEETLIVFTADHGDMTGDHHLWRKTYAYEPSARIPMILRLPKNLFDGKRGATSRLPVELRDLLPTFLDAAGVQVDPKRFDGRSLLDVVRGRSTGWRPHIDLEHDVCYSRENHWTGLTDGKFKYIYHTSNGDQQLFDLERDPGECRDLASNPEHAATLREWRGRMVKHLEERGAPFVVAGDLAPRPESTLYSPYFPGR